ncbi:MAG: NAD(+) synthase [Thermoguttaceae bacterium]|nr:NAD(+) synthase [Thermoguttaceae bacterium]
MTRMRVGAAVLNQTPLDWTGNLRNIHAAIEIARARQVQFLCLPELCVTGYGCEDAFHSLGLQRMAIDTLHEIVAATAGMVVSVGLPLLHKNALFDTACLIADRRIIGFVAKRHLAGEGLHYEPRWFKPWPRGHRDHVLVGNEMYPIGDLVFNCGGVKIGFEICEDAWVAQRPGSDLSLQGVDMIFNPSASHFAFGKIEVRKRFVIEGSRAFSVSYVYSNLVGNEAGRIIYDGGAIIASAGRLLAVGPRFTFQPVDVTTAVVDIDATRMNLARTASFQPDLKAREGAEVICPFEVPDVEPEVSRPEVAAWETSPHVKEEEFARALMLGLFDYLRKSRSQGFVVNLSGGADSSATACLVSMMVRQAAAELGEQGFNRALGYVSGLEAISDSAGRVRRLLHCLYQATSNSSETTRHAATSVAEAIGAEMSCLEIDSLVKAYVDGAQKILGRPLAWQQDDLALQNIQARVRAPSAWLLANVKGALLLATSNRSEAAVGYATMDGDTAGGLSPIAGIDKAYLRRWLRWLQAKGPLGLGPIPALAAVNDLPPTAELRPPESKQTDEGDLMPYEVLDVIERYAIRDKQSPVEVFRMARAQFPQFTVGQLHTWVRRFYLLWSRNQWKRERYAPSFHLDDENLDPKTWCRFPILSGGFARELEELQEYVERNG